MLTSVIIIEKYLTLNLRKKPNYIFASHIEKKLTTVIHPNFVAKICFKIISGPNTKFQFI